MNTSAPPWSLTAGELIESYRSGASTPQSALDAILERIEAVNPRINAIVTLDEASARAAAEESGSRWRDGKPLSALDGVPVTVKDNLYVGDLRATWGSSLYANHVAEKDDIAISRLRAAGCILLGKTNTPELAMAGHTNSPVFGQTRNPWSPDRSPGGSSGGAVAAVASGCGPLALGTDAGGSIRRPAGYTGVAGLKPGVGRVPRRYGFPTLSHDLQVIGQVARTVADLRTVFDIVAQPCSRPAAKGKSKVGLKIAAFGAIGDSPVDPEVTWSFEASCEALRELGHDVEPVEPFWDLDEVGPIFNTIASVGIARVVTSFENWEQRVTEGIAGEARDGLKYDIVDYLDILDRLADFRWRMHDRVSEWDAIATPSAACIPWPLTEPYAKTINGQKASPRAAGAFSVAINLAGLPAVVVPAPRTPDELPTGFQLVGSPNSEHALLDLAEQFESHRPWQRLAPL